MHIFTKIHKDVEIKHYIYILLHYVLFKFYTASRLLELGLLMSLSYVRVRVRVVSPRAAGTQTELSLGVTSCNGKDSQRATNSTTDKIQR